MHDCSTPKKIKYENEIVKSHLRKSSFHKIYKCLNIDYFLNFIFATSYFIFKFRFFLETFGQLPYIPLDSAHRVLNNHETRKLNKNNSILKKAKNQI